jgi:hypothetical protein
VISFSPVDQEMAAMYSTSVTTTENVNVRVKLARSCTHSRVVDEVRDAGGIKTGQLICLECHTEFPDPGITEPRR